MAANTLASIAAATAAGYSLERTTRIDGKNVTRLKKNVSGLPGQSGSLLVFEGEGTTSGNADTASLANLNEWRNNRYGRDSAAASASSYPNAAASPSSQTSAPTHTSLTKDRH
jgi:hypothetical protein